MSETKYSLEWNEFEGVAAKTFKDLLADNNFTDVTLACEDDKQINAHKIILSSCSTFFERIFLKNSSKNLLIYLKGITFKDLGMIMRFIYLGEAEVDQGDLQGFLKASKELEITGLTQNLASSEGINVECSGKSEPTPQEIVNELSENIIIDEENIIIEEETEEIGFNNIIDEDKNEIATLDFSSDISCIQMFGESPTKSKKRKSIMELVP